MTPARVVLAVFMLLQIASPVWAQSHPAYWEERPQQHGGNRQHENGGLLKQLNLSSEQKTQLRQLFEGKKSQRQQDREAMQQKHQQLMQLLKSGSGSKDQVLSLQRDLAHQRSSLMEDRINTLYGIKSILNPQQFQQYQSHMQQHHAQWQNQQQHQENGGDEPMNVNAFR